MGTGAKAAVLGGAAAAVVGVVWFGVVQRPAPGSAPAPSDAASQAADATPAVDPARLAVPSDPAAAMVADAGAGMPDFDVVRIESDGSALVAGRAPQGAEVAVLVDGVQAALTLADAANRFAVMFAIPPDGRPRTLTLRMRRADGTEQLSTVSVFVAPILPVGEAPGGGAAPAALLLAGDGVKVIQPPGERLDEAPEGLSIETIAYAADGAVLLSGRGGAGDFIRLYLDNREIATVAVAADGSWAASLTGIDPGRYQLRADRIDSAGKVVARFETPFARETHEAVAAALQSAAPPVMPATERPAAAGAGASGAGSATTVPLSPSAAAAPVTVTVQPGFSLWRIAQENFGAGVLYVKVYEANRQAIRDPDLIYPGQVFTLPRADE